MKTELQMRRELKKIEALMAAPLMNGSSYDVAYGAHRALTWVLGAQLGARLPASHAVETLEAWAAEHEKQEGMLDPWPDEPGKYAAWLLVQDAEARKPREPK